MTAFDRLIYVLASCYVGLVLAALGSVMRTPERARKYRNGILVIAAVSFFLTLLVLLVGAVAS